MRRCVSATACPLVGALALASSMLSTACGAPTEEGDGTGTAGPTQGSDECAPNGSARSTSNTGTGGDVPATINALVEFLKARSYRDFAAQSAVGASSTHGPIRVFVGPRLEGSLEDGESDTHPIGAAAVRETHDEEHDEPVSWGAMLKLEDASAEGCGWLFVELDRRIGEAPQHAQRGGYCANCHKAGGGDLFRSVYPFE